MFNTALTGKSTSFNHVYIPKLSSLSLSFFWIYFLHLILVLPHEKGESWLDWLLKFEWILVSWRPTWMTMDVLTHLPIRGVWRDAEIEILEEPAKYCKMEYKIYSPHFFLLFSSFSKKKQTNKTKWDCKTWKLIGSFLFIFFDCFVFFYFSPFVQLFYDIGSLYFQFQFYSLMLYVPLMLMRSYSSSALLCCFSDTVEISLVRISGRIDQWLYDDDDVICW